jgi:hypothetical protein
MSGLTGALSSLKLAAHLAQGNWNAGVCIPKREREMLSYQAHSLLLIPLFYTPRFCLAFLNLSFNLDFNQTPHRRFLHPCLHCERVIILEKLEPPLSTHNKKLKTLST